MELNDKSLKNLKKVLVILLLLLTSLFAKSIFALNYEQKQIIDKYSWTSDAHWYIALPLLGTGMVSSFINTEENKDIFQESFVPVSFASGAGFSIQDLDEQKNSVWQPGFMAGIGYQRKLFLQTYMEIGIETAYIIPMLKISMTQYFFRKGIFYEVSVASLLIINTITHDFGFSWATKLGNKSSLAVRLGQMYYFHGYPTYFLGLNYKYYI